MYEVEDTFVTIFYRGKGNTISMYNSYKGETPKITSHVHNGVAVGEFRKPFYSITGPDLPAQRPGASPQDGERARTTGGQHYYWRRDWIEGKKVDKWRERELIP